MWKMMWKMFPPHFSIQFSPSHPPEHLLVHATAGRAHEDDEQQRRAASDGEHRAHVARAGVAELRPALLVGHDTGEPVPLGLR